MSGRSVLLTGATSGIGRAAAKALGASGASVGIVARDRARGEAVLAELRTAGPSGTHQLFLADLASQSDVRALATQVLAAMPRLNVLFLNAGVYVPHRETTPDGYERSLAVNHLAPFLLTHLLQDRLRANAPSRIVLTASAAHKMAKLDLTDLQSERRYRGFSVYGKSKLANILFTYAMARRLEGTGVTINCFHPGVIRSGLFGSGGGRIFALISYPFMRSPQHGARTGVYLATSPEVEGVTGRYFSGRKAIASSAPSQDVALQEALWKESVRLCHLA